MLTIATAQINPVSENINSNLDNHYSLINLAADNGAQLIVFPEMSITGYLKESANKLSFTENDARLDKLRELAVDKQIVVIAGVPIKMNCSLHIGSYILFPDKSISIYTKQFLHTGEDEFFKSNYDYNPTISLGNEKFSLAICADIDNPLHAEKAYKNNCTIYIASIFFTKNAILEAHNKLSSYAKKYSIDVIMSNYCGKSYGLDAGGASAIWSTDGNKVAELDNKSIGIVIGQKDNDIWSGFVIKI